MKNRLLTGSLLIVLNLVLSPEILARPEYVAVFGARGCTDCHNDNYGNGFKPALLTALQGGSAGVQAYIDSLKAVVPTNTAPVLSPINPQWDVTVGEVPLKIPFQITDKQNDTVALHGITPTGITVSPPRIDTVTQLRTIDLKWSPTAIQANKKHPISIYAQETTAGKSLKSNTVTAKISVWPARTTATKNVQQFIVQNARWTAGHLTLSGLVIFKPTVTAAQRTASLNTLRLAIRSNNNVAIPVGVPTPLKPTATGAWTKTFTLSGTQVPCLVKVVYEGLNSSRTVTAAPATTCVQ